jgi:glycerophosphoryl diester phosphodiesterase
MSLTRIRAQALASALVSALMALVAGAVVLASPSAAFVPGSCVDAAHRGYQAHFAENSMRAFRAAVYRRANYLEMDVQVTKDGHVAVMHDRTIDRTTTGTGRISDMTWAQLRAVRLDDGQSVPSLAAVLDMARPTPSGALVELKWVPRSRFAEVDRIIDAFGASRVMVNSFSPYVVSHFHHDYPDVATAIEVNRPITVTQAQAYGGVMPDWRHVTDAWLADLRAAGVPTYLWTVDTAAGWQRFSGRVTLLLTNRAADYQAWRSRHC